MYSERHCADGELVSFQPPFAPRFAQSLLLLQKHWDADFLQPFKDVAGNLSVHSIRSQKAI